MTIEETDILDFKFDDKGLIAAIVQDVTSKDVLMMAWMNKESFHKTIETGQAHYWSRSRQELWHKGATSGSIQYVKEIHVDCDQDAILLMVEQQQGENGGGACHTGRKSCFYRKITSKSTLVFLSDKK